MPKDFHCILKADHEQMLEDIANKIWQDAGNKGQHVQYESKAARLAISRTHREMFPEKYQTPAV